MDRRKFLIAPIVLAGLTLHKSVEAKASGVFMFKNILRMNQIQLKDGEAFKAEAGKTLILPKNPKHGDKYMFSVDSNSLTNPCRLKDEKYTIAGDTELILDCPANFSLSFNEVSKNWDLV